MAITSGTSRVYLSVISANILLLISGTALIWSSPVLPKLSNSKTTPFSSKISPEQSSWVSSLVMLGATIGPFLFGYLQDKIGRKPTVLYLGVPFLVCYLMLALGKSVEIFYVARFITGLAVGGALIVVPIYIGEIAEDSNRGALSSSMGCFMSLGVFFTCSIGPYVSLEAFNYTFAALSTLFLLLFFLVGVETPQYFASVGDTDQARDTLEKIRSSKDMVERELVDMQVSKNGSFLEIFRSPACLKAFTISVGLMVFQQFSGINALLFYSQQIFHQAGTTLPPEICTIIITGMQFASSFVTPMIADKCGRKLILVYSALGMVLSLGPLGTYCILKSHGVNLQMISFLPVVALVFYIVAFNVGFGPLPWALLSELFPADLKSIASALVACIVWVLSFFVTKYFEVFVVIFGIGQLFIFFGFCCVLAMVFTWFYVVETRGKSLQEIQEILDS